MGVLTGTSIIFSPSGLRADVCVSEAWNNGSAGVQVQGWLFPNWSMVHLGSFDVVTCDGCSWVATENITGLTVVNFGTATEADLSNIYWRATCIAGKSSVDSGLQTMSYAGAFIEDSGTYPAWTWNGNSVDLNICDSYGDPWGSFFTIDIYADIGPCPTQYRTVQLGFPVNSTANPLLPGSITDNADCAAPFVDMMGEAHSIAYAFKRADRKTAPPGDTITYTLFYGLAGTDTLTSIVLFDTLPPFTHYINDSSSPTADPDWNPDPGPPARLRWTAPGPINTALGRTSEITFKVSVDWGNGESFEPGSGDAAAPEGFQIGNSAQVRYEGANCPVISIPTNLVQTAVQRFLFWKVADNDVLFASSLGSNPDEIVYSIFIKNVSTKKTWWDVSIWDTVPQELDIWAVTCGFDDPIVGYTMSPTALAPGRPSWTDTAGTTRLNWAVDLLPGGTIELRWKAIVKNDSEDGDVAWSRASILERGKTGIVGGTGHSTYPAVFTHEAPIILRTIYMSYLSLGAGTDAWWGCCNDDPVFAQQTYFISFFPLNRQTDFTLYKQEHVKDAFADEGGLSASINQMVGGCTTVGIEWIPGCRSERAPAFYKPSNYAACETTTPLHNLFKLISNSPIIWEMLTGDIHAGSECATFAPTTSLTYRGYGSYSYCRTCAVDTNADGLFFINTSSEGPTTVHVFSWDSESKTWQYRASSLIAEESIWFYLPSFQGSYRVISSDYPLIIYKGLPVSGNDSYRTMAPNTENGLLVSGDPPSTFYAYSLDDNRQGGSVIVGNVGTATATYQISKYKADDPLAPIISAKHQTSFLVGNSGNWIPIETEIVPPGIGDPANPHAYQLNYETGVVRERTFYRVKLLEGGPIYVYSGWRMHSSFEGAHVIHSADGSMSGYEFWFHQTEPMPFAGDCKTPLFGTMGIDLFCPKTGTSVRGYSSDGYDTTIVTDAPDECISFKALTPPAAGLRRNWAFESTGGIMAVCIANACALHQKMFTAPFVAQGIHYRLIMPPVVYAGQEFWITVVVAESAGGTKDDYCGITAFTATDPLAEIEGMPMADFNYSWTNDIVPCGLGFDNGVKVFAGVVMQKLGLQNIIAADTVDGSIVGLGVTMVVGVDLKLTKDPYYSTLASGDTVQFRICWSNFSSASALELVITDAVPKGTQYLPADPAAHLCGGTYGDLTDVTVAYSTTDNQPASFQTMAGPVSSPLPTWLRWTVPVIGIKTTGCVCFEAMVN